MELSTIAKFPCTPSCISYRRYMPRKTSNGGAVAGDATWLNVYGCTFPFSGVRLKFVANDVEKNITCYVAVSPTATNDGSALTWTQVTVNGSGSITVPANSGVTTELLSDLVKISSVARTDTGTDYLLQIRVFGNGIKYSDSTLNLNASSKSVEAFGVGNEFRWLRFGANRVNSGAMTPSTNDYGEIQVSAVGFVPLSGQSFSIASIGDSLDQGWNTQGTAVFQASAPVYFAAQRLRDLGYQAEGNPIAIAGQTHASTISTFLAYALEEKPDFITMRFWSPNGNTGTQAWFDGTWAETMDALRQLKAANVIPILQTSPPAGLVVGTGEAIRQAMNAKIRALKGRFIVADIDLAVRDPADIDSLLPAYMDPTPNTTHLSLAGYQKCGETIADALVWAVR